MLHEYLWSHMDRLAGLTNHFNIPEQARNSWFKWWTL